MHHQISILDFLKDRTEKSALPLQYIHMENILNCTKYLAQFFTVFTVYRSHKCT